MLSNTDINNIHTQIPFFSANSDVALKNQYSLKIVIESILWIKDLTDNDISISFYNPIYQKLYTIPNYINIQINEHIYLKNIKCRMNLEISSDEVQDIFNNWSPTVIFCNKDNTIFTQCSLDISTFKLNKLKEQTFLTTSLYAQNGENEKLADINIILTVYDNNIKVSTQVNSNLAEPNFFQMSQQLEIWKEKQKQIFKNQEKARISLLLEEWQQEKSKLQEKLLKNIQYANNALQEIKHERDYLKATIQTELNKRNIDCTHMDFNRSETKKKCKNEDVNDIKQTKTTREINDLNELKKIIEKQIAQIKSIRGQYESDLNYENLRQTVDTLKTQLLIKDTETEYLKQQWAKTTRQLNSYIKHYTFLKTKHTAVDSNDNMLPLMIQQLLDIDAEHKNDLDKLHSIQQELKELPKKNDQMTSRKEDISEIDLLLQTRTYSTDDKLIQLLNRRKIL